MPQRAWSSFLAGPKLQPRQERCDEEKTASIFSVLPASKMNRANEPIDVDLCNVFTSLRLNRYDCSDIVNEIETVLKNPESTEPPFAKSLDGVEVTDSIGASPLNLDATPLGLDIHKDFLFCTLFFENKKELEDFLSFLKDELR